MFKWLRDARYNDVLASLKQIEARIEAIESRQEILATNMNSLRGYVNKKGLKTSVEPEQPEPLNEEAAARAMIEKLKKEGYV